MKKLVVVVVLTAAVSFGLGALSESVVAQLAHELSTRSFRELVNRDLMRGWSQSGEAYFQGRADGYGAASKVNFNEPHVSAYLLGFGEALNQSSALITEAEQTGKLQ